MKNLLCILALACFLFSCSKDEELIVETEQFSLDQYPQKWQLVSMTGNIANAKPLTGTGMPWQEYYLLHADGTFKKYREENDQSMAASGTFAFRKSNSDTYNNLVFTYAEKLPIVGTCTEEPVEHMMLLSSDSMHNNWNACDGPGLLYKRVKYEASGDAKH